MSLWPGQILVALQEQTLDVYFERFHAILREKTHLLDREGLPKKRYQPARANNYCFGVKIEDAQKEKSIKMNLEKNT